MWYVYILICKEKKSYIGCTNDLRDRIIRHKNGYVKATKSRLPIKLESYFAFTSKKRAFEFEKYLKSGQGRIFLKKRIF